MLSGLPAQAFWRARRNQFRSSSSRANSASEEGRKSPDHDGILADPSELLAEPQLKDLNACLGVLTTLFPDVRSEVLREMLFAFSEESRLELVVEQLIKHKAQWVKGRWRVPMARQETKTYKYRTTHPARLDGEGLSESEKFRSKSYKSAVKAALYQEFKGMNNSTIRAVLAEYNYSYTDARPTLLALSSKSWRLSLANLFLKRKTPSPIDHPLIIWQMTPSGIYQATLKATPNEELNAELHQTLIAPLHERKIEEQIFQDATLAEQLNDEEAEEADAMLDCEVCFTASSFELMTVCDDGGHYICFRCVRHTMKEVLYGQGWARSIDAEKATLACIAPAPDDECHGCVPQDLLKRALGDTKEGRETWKKFEERAAGESLIKSQVALTKCPFCIYAEVDDAPSQHAPPPTNLWTLQAAAVIVVFFCIPEVISSSAALQIYILLGLVIIMLFSSGRRLPSFYSLNNHAPLLYSLLNSHAPFLRALYTEHAAFLQSLLDTLFNPTHTLMTTTSNPQRFTCRHPACARASCLTCRKPWRDIHQCYTSERLALRAHVEAAMADAVKRTCPRCHLSFVKSEACNKMTCLCGYKMCYVCRKAIGKDEGYGHFCQHFRVNPGQACEECDRCDLYRVEAEAVLVGRAKERAEREWREREGFNGGWKWEDRVPDS